MLCLTRFGRNAPEALRHSDKKYNTKQQVETTYKRQLPEKLSSAKAPLLLCHITSCYHNINRFGRQVLAGYRSFQKMALHRKFFACAPGRSGLLTGSICARAGKKEEIFTRLKRIRLF
jgi:hypothetical protein